MKLHLFYHIYPKINYKCNFCYNFDKHKGSILRYIFLASLLWSLSFAAMLDIHSFEADFEQSITNDKNETLIYRGHVVATAPQFALWSYQSPIQKEIYINAQKVVMIEADLEQVIIKKIQGDFDFFSIIKHAKQVNPHLYLATFQDMTYRIAIDNSMIRSIRYKNELDNTITIRFTHQKADKHIDLKRFVPDIPMDYDIVRG